VISVLIPTYNYNALSLVKEIHSQLTHSKVPFEIICLDDASVQNVYVENNQINTLDFSKFEVLAQNIGRSKIRNKLASQAAYDWLLFLDVDVLPKNTNFIASYLKAISNETPVICGGINYEAKQPVEAKLLRWTYGTKREAIPVSQRINNPYKHFLSSNFLIHKKLFFDIKFNELLTTYGHEDTLFAVELKNKQTEIKHIDNAVYHLGIEPNIVFIEKVRASIENANYLYQHQLIRKGDITLTDKFIRFKALRIDGFMAWIFRKFKQKWEQNLCSKKPSLFVFDIYKLGYLCLINQ